jgi:heme exporter protein CcmD
MDSFLAMGGYGTYVWPAYVISALTLGGLTVWILTKAGKARRKLAARERALQEKSNG